MIEPLLADEQFLANVRATRGHPGLHLWWLGQSGFLLHHEGRFALGGLMLRDPVIEVSDMLTTILVALMWDVLLTPFVLPPVMLLFARMQPARVAY